MRLSGARVTQAHDAALAVGFGDGGGNGGFEVALAGGGGPGSLRGDGLGSALFGLGGCGFDLGGLVGFVSGFGGHKWRGCCRL